jgi:hypothetical protein
MAAIAEAERELELESIRREAKLSPGEKIALAFRLSGAASTFAAIPTHEDKEKVPPVQIWRRIKARGPSPMNRPPLELERTFEQVCSSLEAVGIDYALMGAFAAITWGRVRTTIDVVLVLTATPERFKLFEEKLIALGYQPGRHVGPSEPTDVLPDMAVFWSGDHPAIRIDVFIAKLEFERDVLARKRRESILGRITPVVAPEASIIYKLLASRGRDLDDIKGIFEARRIVGEHLDWAFLDHWAHEWEITERLAPWKTQYGPGT